MGAKSRNKGNAFERKVAKILSDWSGLELRRTPLSGGWSSDSRVSGDLVAIDHPEFYMHVECKKQEAFSWEATLQGHGIFYDWWEQAANACPETKFPVVIFQKNRGDIWIAFRPSDFEYVSVFAIEPEWAVLHYNINILALSVFCKHINYRDAVELGEL